MTMVKLAEQAFGVKHPADSIPGPADTGTDQH